MLFIRGTLYYLFISISTITEFLLFNDFFCWSCHYSCSVNDQINLVSVNKRVWKRIWKETKKREKFRIVSFLFPVSRFSLISVTGEEKIIIHLTHWSTWTRSCTEREVKFSDRAAERRPRLPGLSFSNIKFIAVRLCSRNPFRITLERFCLRK